MARGSTLFHVYKFWEFGIKSRGQEIPKDGELTSFREKLKDPGWQGQTSKGQGCKVVKAFENDSNKKDHLQVSCQEVTCKGTPVERKTFSGKGKFIKKTFYKNNKHLKIISQWHPQMHDSNQIFPSRNIAIDVICTQHGSFRKTFFSLKREHFTVWISHFMLLKGR